MTIKLTRYLTPQNFYALSNHLWLPLLLASVVLFTLGLWGAFFYAPADYQQGEGFRIIYVHVPSAYLSMMIYGCMTVAAILSLIFRLKIATFMMDACMPLGALFSFLALLTGAIWGKPMWGTWWIWDARLTSELILFLWYLLLMSLRQAIHQQQHGVNIRAVLVLIGSVNLPIIHFSVQWWNTLHQGATFSAFTKPAMHSDMLCPLLIMLAASTCYFIAVLLLEMQRLILQHAQPR